MDTRDPVQYLEECVNIEPVAIQEEYVRVPADLAYWNAKFSDALKAFLLAKLALSKVEARLQLETRASMEGGKTKVTESVITAMIESSDDWAKVKLALVDAECEKVRLWGVCDALRSKKEMLVSLGATLRSEMEGDPMLRSYMRDQHDGDVRGK